MTDYGESEKLPPEVVCSLETIEESVGQGAANKSALEALRMLVRQTIISRTGALATGCALLETLTVIIGLLMIAQSRSQLAECLLVSLTTVTYV